MTHGPFFFGAFFFGGGSKKGATQAEYADAVMNCCTHVASARVQTINIMVKRDIHMCMSSLGATFIQRCNSALKAYILFMW